ncbi:hypothetical protein LEP1GSC050_0689 [Leptospira broomii serovar Hurstbridge str. 5399]|uniref:Uncharacterized protein n=1 Tax=Leptospira broomii serovar Hurstbridge str. 5399 TaxID=1049789 RepID=T0GIR2_9LEPT|nr:hypothetical protein LEP1GSC050_0689 [Leptospira broomii serovar Hurstbridge str. 5399]
MIENLFESKEDRCLADGLFDSAFSLLDSMLHSVYGFKLRIEFQNLVHLIQVILGIREILLKIKGRELYRLYRIFFLKMLHCLLTMAVLGWNS